MDIPQGYKQTELGIIPDDWEVKRISDFTSMALRNKWTLDK